MKRWILTTKKSAFIVEHDFIMATYLADKVLCFDGTPAQETFCRAPQPLITGMNTFLRLMDTTFRRDPRNNRPRINLHGSRKDQEQKKMGNYFDDRFLEDSDSDEEDAYDAKPGRKPAKKAKGKKKGGGDQDNEPAPQKEEKKEAPAPQ